MRILFVGHKDRGVRCLEALVKTGHTIVAVITDPRIDPHKFWNESVKEKAKALKLPVEMPHNINDPVFVDRLRRLSIDLIVLSGYAHVLGSRLLKVPKKGVINLHAGKIPFYRGGSPLNWAMINGETEGWLTIHYCTEQIDAGPILCEERFTISSEETIKEIWEKSLRMFPEMLIRVVDRIEKGTQMAMTRDLSQGTYYRSRKPKDGQIDWKRMTAKNVYDFVRALTHPFPGAFCFLDGKKMFVWKAALFKETIRYSPGEVCRRNRNGCVVMAKDHGLVVERVQLEADEEKAAIEVLEKGVYLT